MAGRLEGKVALITGGASGQGRVAAVRFAAEGARVALSDVNEEGGVQTMHMVQENGGEAYFVRGDVSAEGSARDMVDAAVRKYGALHILYNNAGIVGANIDGDVTQLSVETWDQILNINLRGIFLCSKYGVPALMQAGGGSVINTASIAGLIGSPFAGHAYTASKGGVIALTRAMAMAYARHKVRVNAHLSRWCGDADDRALQSRSVAVAAVYRQPSHRPCGHARRYRAPRCLSGLGRIFLGDWLDLYDRWWPYRDVRRGG